MNHQQTYAFALQKKHQTNYINFRYIYPPSCDLNMPSKELERHDNMEYLAQPIYQGTQAVVFTNGIELLIFDSNKEGLQLLTNQTEIEFRKLALNKGEWYVFAGTYLNKGKVGETGIKERKKFIIWDTMVWGGRSLVGVSLTARMDLLNSLEFTAINGIQLAQTFETNFREVYNQTLRTELYGGVILKRKDSTLSIGLDKKNNRSWQMKFRKPTSLNKY